MTYKYDFLIIGAGIAGMSYALKVARAHKGKICLICKTALDEANTSFAQGGVASVTNLKVDNFDKHIEDTMIAGDYISDRAAVEQVVRMAPEQITELVHWGVNFDKQSNGEFDLHRDYIVATNSYITAIAKSLEYEKLVSLNSLTSDLLVRYLHRKRKVNYQDVQRIFLKYGDEESSFTKY
jgi:succinate dehydrogenase/fumarate reductase flavoprotein subunit